MNRKGFTLIEVLAVILIISIIGVLIAPGILDSLNDVKKTSCESLIKNIASAAESYYTECEYGDLSEDKYGEYKCSISNNTITISLGTLANTGFLKVSDIDANEKKIVLNPKTKENISNCNITIKKEVSADFKVTYTVTNDCVTCGD